MLYRKQFGRELYIFINTPPYSVATQQVTTPYEYLMQPQMYQLYFGVMELHVSHTKWR